MYRAADPQQALSPSTAAEFAHRRLRVGFGLRACHYDTILERGVHADLVEAISENFMSRGGRAHAVLERVRAETPIALHGVSLSIGGMDPLSERYLDELCQLAGRVEPASISDHLCFGTFAGHYAHDLWPLPYTEEALAHLVDRVRRVQDRLQRQILLENVSSYVEYEHSTLAEWEFLSEVANGADCGILLDVNNVYVNAQNHGFSGTRYVQNLPHQRVQQIHLAGHRDGGGFLLDDHGSSVSEPVWQLYEETLALVGPIPTIIEWDERVPELSLLEAEAEQARRRGSVRLGLLQPEQRTLP